MNVEWTPLALAEQVRGPAPLAVTWDGVPWLLARLDGAVRVLHDLCPHRRVPLSAGQVVDLPTGQAVECGYHGWAFGADGHCAAIPALGEGRPPRGMGGPLALPVLERYSVVWAARTTPAESAALAVPRLPEAAMALRSRLVDLAADRVVSALGAPDGRGPGPLPVAGDDRLAFAVRPVSPIASEVFPFLLDDALTTGVPAWLDLLDGLAPMTLPA